MSNIATENWFDYEINNKLPMSLLDSMIESNIEEIDKIFDAIDICNENGIEIVGINEGVGDKIKEIIEFIKEKLETIKKVLSTLLSEHIKKLIELLKKAKAKLGDKFEMYYIPDFKISFKDESIGEKFNPDTLDGFKKYFEIDNIIRFIQNNNDDALDQEDTKNVIEKIQNIKIEPIPFKNNGINDINDVDNGSSSVHSYTEIVKKIDACTKMVQDTIDETSLMQKMADNFERKNVYSSSVSSKDLSTNVKSVILFFKVYLNFLNTLKSVLIQIITNGINSVKKEVGL